MPDVFTKRKRSEVMARIRGRGNKETELAFAAMLRQHSITGWRRHPDMLGRPDFVFRDHRLAIFVDGCFWHCCPRHSKVPTNNREFWQRKLKRNVDRDRLVTKALRAKGWHVLRVWEHDLGRCGQAKCLRRLSRLLQAPR